MTSSNKKLLTSEYEAQLVEKHRTKPWGGGGASWIPEVIRMVLAYRERMKLDGHLVLSCASFLDYGAGRRTFSTVMQWLMPHARVYDYDPGVPAMSTLPIGQFDFVLCTDVMEHVEQQFVLETLQRIHGYARYAVLFNIALTPSKSLLPNGQNAHVTVKPGDWWCRKLLQVFPELEHLEHHKGLTLVAHKQARR